MNDELRRGAEFLTLRNGDLNLFINYN